MPPIAVVHSAKYMNGDVQVGAVLPHYYARYRTWIDHSGLPVMMTHTSAGYHLTHPPD